MVGNTLIRGSLKGTQASPANFSVESEGDPGIAPSSYGAQKTSSDPGGLGTSEVRLLSYAKNAG